MLLRANKQFLLRVTLQIIKSNVGQTCKSTDCGSDKPNFGVLFISASVTLVSLANRAIISQEWWLFPRLRGFWEKVGTFHHRLRLFFVLFKERLARAHLFHTLCQDQYSVAQRAETTVAEHSLTSCVGECA